MNKLRFQIDITGPSGPDEVSASDLAEFLISIEKSVIACASEFGLELPEEGPVISLVDIAPSSDRLVFSAPEPVVPAVASMTNAILSEDYDDLPRETHQELYEISERARQRGWGIEFKENKRYGILPAKITPTKGVHAPVKPSEITGTTTLIARCLRVGGVMPKAELRLHNRTELLYVDVTEEIAKALGKKLYEEVVLEGKATWRKDVWQVIDFQVASVSEFRRVDPHLAFKELSEVANGRWDGVDAIEYVRQIREED